MKFDTDVFVKNVAQTFLDAVESINFSELHHKRELVFYEARALERLLFRRVSHASNAVAYDAPTLSSITIQDLEETKRFCRLALVLQTMGLRSLELPEQVEPVLRAWVADQSRVRQYLQVLQEPVSAAEVEALTNAMVEFWKLAPAWTLISVPGFFYVHAKREPIDVKKKR